MEAKKRRESGEDNRDFTELLMRGREEFGRPFGLDTSGEKEPSEKQIYFRTVDEADFSHFLTMHKPNPKPIKVVIPKIP
jgi:hypothetical protein